MRKWSFPKPGFTLVELLIAVGILALLGAIAQLNYLEAGVRSQLSRARYDLRTVASAVEAYIVDWSVPPHAALRVGYTTDSDHQISRTGLYAFTPLTTPVAYLATTAREDPFCPPFAGYDSTGIIPGRLGQPFTYYFINIQGSELGWAWSGGPYPLAAAKGHWSKYLIISLGPDAIKGPDQRPGRSIANGWSNNNYCNTVEGLKHARWAIQNYDPSNGSASYGDLLHWQE